MNDGEVLVITAPDPGEAELELKNWCDRQPQYELVEILFSGTQGMFHYRPRGFLAGSNSSAATEFQIQSAHILVARIRFSE